MTDKCSACGGTEFLRHSQWHGEEPICRPCFMIWYDCPANVEVTSPEQVGAFSLKMKAEGKWPWTGDYASPRTEEEG